MSWRGRRLAPFCGIAGRCWRKRPVGVLSLAICSGGPWATSWPPCLPASGPRSRIQSADLMTSKLCSMTSRVWPESTSFWKTDSRRSMSEKWRPVVGSSRMRSFGCRDGSDDCRVGREELAEFEALGFAAGEGVEGLAEFEVAEADFGEGLEGGEGLLDEFAEFGSSGSAQRLRGR